MEQTFGAFLRHLRKRSGMTQTELAERLGYSRSMVGALEQDERLPNVDEVIDIYVSALGLQDERELAAQLVELAARARQIALPSASASKVLQPPLFAAQHPDKYRIPLPPTRLLGREREVKTLAERALYQDARLTTLVGPPGVGKTRLAQEVASRLAFYFPDGACFVALAGVTTPDAVAGSILAALELLTGALTPLAALVSHLRRKQILLVLDNFEQVLVAAPLVADLLAQCAGLHIVVTSRERLHLRAEHVAVIRPLALDAAVELFLARAEAANDRFLLTNIAPNLVQSICQRLDCLPLAIELCAARLDYFALEQIDEYLRNNPLDTLVDGAADLAPHQRTLRGAILTSYNLLTDNERKLLHGLSVFEGGATPATAEEVWEGDDETVRFIDVIRSLVAKSLVQVEVTSFGERRLHLLESVREFVQEQLQNDGRMALVRSRHFDAVLRFTRVAEAGLCGPDAAIWNKRMQHEMRNWQVAVQWAFEHAMWEEMATLHFLLYQRVEKSPRRKEFFDWFEKLVSVAHNLDPDLQMAIQARGVIHESIPHSNRTALQQEYSKCLDACVSPLVKAEALCNIMQFGFDLVDVTDAMSLAINYARAGHTTPEHTLVYGTGWSREVTLPLCLEFSGVHKIERGETVESTALLTEALAQFRAQGYILETARSYGFLGRAALLEGRDEEAIAWFEDAVANGVALDNIFDVVEWHSWQGLAFVYAGDLERAGNLLAVAWENALVYGAPFLMQIVVLCQGELALAEGKFDAARQWVAEAVAISGRTTLYAPWQPIHRAMLAARLAAAEGNDLRAAQLYGFMQAYSDRIKLGPTGPVRDTAAPTMAAVRARLGDEVFWRLYEDGGRLSPEEALVMLTDMVREQRQESRKG